MAGISVDFSGLLQIFVFAIRVTSTGAQIVSACVLLMQVFFLCFPFFLPAFPFPYPPSPSPPLHPLLFVFFFLIAFFFVDFPGRVFVRG